jgi:GDPmannose 4,6-dehydratase
MPDALNPRSVPRPHDDRGASGVPTVEKEGTDHRDHRPGRFVPGRAPARQGLRGPRPHPPGVTFNTERIDHVYQGPAREPMRRLFLHYGDLHDGARSGQPAEQVVPDEVYHLGAQSHVRVSFDMPEYTGDVTGHRDHPAARGHPDASGLTAASTRRVSRRCSARAPAAERGHPVPPAQPRTARQGLRVLDDPQLPRGVRDVRGERHPLQPREPPPWRDLRHAQDHPQRRPHPGRPAGAPLPRQPDAARDWGYAPSTSRRCGGCCSTTSPSDFVVATGTSYTVRDFLQFAFDHAGLDWEKHVKFDERYLRPTEVDSLIGDRQSRQAAGLAAEDVYSRTRPADG